VLTRTSELETYGIIWLDHSQDMSIMDRYGRLYIIFTLLCYLHARTLFDVHQL